MEHRPIELTADISMHNERNPMSQRLFITDSSREKEPQYIPRNTVSRDGQQTKTDSFDGIMIEGSCCFFFGFKVQYSAGEARNTTHNHRTSSM